MVGLHRTKLWNASAVRRVTCAGGQLEVCRMVVPVDFVMSLSAFAVMLSSRKLACDVITHDVTVTSSMTSLFRECGRWFSSLDPIHQ